MANPDDTTGRDLTLGVALQDLPDGGCLQGQVAGEDAILVRRGDALFAVGASCSHYHGPLAEGLIVDDTVRCPWHHACFSLRTGEATAPALDSIPCWRVERAGDTVYVRERQEAPAKTRPAATKSHPASVVIVGGGAAGLAAADMLRRQGYAGPVTMLSSDAAPPCDRPNLSKDFLAGTAPEEWIPLRPAEYFDEHHISLVLGARVAALDIAQHRVTVEDGTTYDFGALLLATGADPVRLEIPGADPGRLCFLRSLADSRAIVSRLASARRVLVVGASFIGLEAAAALRSRGLDVDVVAPEQQPLARVLGEELGGFLRGVHEAHGVSFHLGQTVEKMEGRRATLSGGDTVEADFVVVGAGVRPDLSLAERAGLAVDRGIVVNEYLETSVPGIFAAGDVARYPDPRTGQRVRIEHWVVAQRQGQTAARNMLGQRQPFRDVPFFWTQQYDTQVSYVGHAEGWDEIKVEGSLQGGDATVTYRREGRVLATATLGRDIESLRAELAMERSS